METWRFDPKFDSLATIAVRNLLFAGRPQWIPHIFASFIADEVEFYHDQAGVTLGKDALTEAIKRNICCGTWVGSPAPTVYRDYRIATSNSQYKDKIRLLASRSIA